MHTAKHPKKLLETGGSVSKTEYSVFTTTYCFHFLESGDEVSIQWAEGVDGDGLDVGDDVLDGLGGEGSEHELPELGVVVACVEEDGLLSQHPLFASRECGLEEMSIRHQHLPRRLRARDHHAGVAQYVALEYGAIPVIKLNLY